MNRFRWAHSTPGLKPLLTLILFVPLSCSSAETQATAAGAYHSAYFSVQLTDDQPAIAALSVDSLGKGKLLPSPLRVPALSPTKYVLERSGDKVEYRAPGAAPDEPPPWTFAFSSREIRLHSAYSRHNPPPALLLDFDPHLNRATLLGLMNDD